MQLMPNVVYYENWTMIDRDHIELSDDRNKFLRERVHVLQSISGGGGCSSAQQHKGGDPIWHVMNCFESVRQRKWLWTG